MRLCILCDTSGSMSEGGKQFALLTALKTLEQYIWLKDLDIEIIILTLGAVEHKLDWKDYRSVCNTVGGSFELRQRLGQPAVKEADKLLILSDCCWKVQDKRAFINLTLSKGQDFAKALIIGNEADSQSRSANFIPADNLLALLERWLSC